MVYWMDKKQWLAKVPQFVLLQFFVDLFGCVFVRSICPGRWIFQQAWDGQLDGQLFQGVRTSLVIRILAAFCRSLLVTYMTIFNYNSQKWEKLFVVFFCGSHWLIDMNFVSETSMPLIASGLLIAPFPICEGSSLRHTHVKQRIPKKVDVKKSFLFTHNAIMYVRTRCHFCKQFLFAS